VNPSARLRREIADRVAQALLASGEAREVWLEGALACGFAHAASDIDLRGIVDGAFPAWESRIVDGVRVDLHATAPQRAEELRHLLRSFDVRRDDLGSFRRVRASMHDLLCLRTALSYGSERWDPVLDPGEREGYRRWAVADQAEAGDLPHRPRVRSGRASGPGRQVAAASCRRSVPSADRPGPHGNVGVVPSGSATRDQSASGLLARRRRGAEASQPGCPRRRLAAPAVRRRVVPSPRRRPPPHRRRTASRVAVHGLH